MNKQLDQIDEMLSGRGRYKLLDPNRKTLLSLPPTALKLWLTYWMFESDEQEAYPSLDRLEQVTHMDRKTILKQREYLLETGWLVKLTGTAAERYSKPTRGANTVAVYRVDDPTKGGKIPPQEQRVENLHSPKFPPNVCSCCCTCPCSCIGIEAVTTLKLKAKTGAAYSPSETSSLRSDEEQKPNQQQNQKQQQQPVRLSSAAKWLAKYDAPKPVEFDSWNQETRSKWTVDHDRKNLKVSVPVEVKPEPKPMVLPVELKQDVPALPPVVESATPMSPKSGLEPHKAVTAPTKAPVLSATPTPPNSAPPPKPEPVDYRLKWVKMLAKDISTFQTCFNDKVKPPTDWETAWLADTDAMVKLAEGKGSMSGTMLTSVIALSQVRYATNYTTPGAILADVLTLGREVVELITQGTFEEVWNAYHEVFRSPEQPDENELDEKEMYVDPEVKAAREQKELANRIARWNTWLDANTPQQKSA
jgi:hypothetical protein